MRVLLVEDDQTLNQSIAAQLEKAGYSVDRAEDGREGLYYAQEYPIDLAIVDLGLPSLSGVELIKQVRADGKAYPILVLTARDSVADRVKGLDAGADDYLVKPFALEELLARVRAMLRRQATARAAKDRGRLVYHAITIDRDTREATVEGRRVGLRNREFELLTYFVRNPGRVLSRQELREEVWGDDFPGDSNVIEVTIGHLRRKLEEHGLPRVVHTVRQIGYMLRWPAEQ